MMIGYFQDCKNWTLRCGESSLSFFGDPVDAQLWIAFGLLNDVTERHPTFPPTIHAAVTLSKCLDATINCESERTFALASDQRMWGGVSHFPFDNIMQFSSQPLFALSTILTTKENAAPSITVQNPEFPAPVPNHCHDGTLFEKSYGIPFVKSIGTNSVCAASTHAPPPPLGPSY